MLTLSYNEGLGCAASPPECAEATQCRMYTWVRAHVPLRMRRGVDYVLFSYYPEHSPDFKPDWKREFARIGEILPQARLGFGELGMDRGTEAQKAALIDQFTASAHRPSALHQRPVLGDSPGQRPESDRVE